MEVLFIKGKYKIILLISMLFILLAGVSAASIAVNEVEAKKITDTKKISKKIDTKPKVIKTIKNTKIIQINGKNHTLKKASVSGRYAPKVYYNKKYILVINAHCTCGKHKWKQGKTVIFENDVRFAGSKKFIPKGKSFKIAFNPKKVPDGEFTVRNKGTRHHDYDLCMFCGSDKNSGKGKVFMKILYKK